MADEPKSRLGNIIALITALTGLVAALAAGIPAVSKLFNDDTQQNQIANAVSPVPTSATDTAASSGPTNGTDTAASNGPTPPVALRGQTVTMGTPAANHRTAPVTETVYIQDTPTTQPVADSPATHEEPTADPTE